MSKSESIQELAKALAQFQATMQTVTRNAANSFFKSKYLTLDALIEAIRGPLAAVGLSYVQFPTGTAGLTTMLIHTSGQWIEDTMQMTPVDNKPQSTGSCLTYSRRYALGSVLGIATDEDDDGNEASKPVSVKEAFKAPPPAVPVTGGPVPVPNTTAKPAYAPCDTPGCTGTANLKFGNTCWNCGQKEKALKASPATP